MWQLVPKSATSLSSYGQTRVKMMTSRYNVDLWHLMQVGDASHGTPSVYQVKFVGLPVPKMLHIFRPALIDLVTLTFDLSTSKWDYGAFFLANFQLPIPLRSRLRIMYGTEKRTDGQTDNGHHCTMPPTLGEWWHNFCHFLNAELVQWPRDNFSTRQLPHSSFFSPRVVTQFKGEPRQHGR